MHNPLDLPNDIEMEKELISALLVRNGEIIPEIDGIISAEDFYRPEHKIIFSTILRLFAQGIPPNLLSIVNELRPLIDAKKIDLQYLYYLSAAVHTNAYAVTHAKTLKEKSNLRRLMLSAEILFDAAQRGFLAPVEIITHAQQAFDEIISAVGASNKISFNDYFNASFTADIEDIKSYAERKTGFANIDKFQFFPPGLYVVGATPGAGKTTFCWQLLNQLANNGETCIYCTYEMSRLELFTKSLACELFKRDARTALTAAQIRRGGVSKKLREVIADLSQKPALNFSVLELQDETADDLLRLLRPFCSDKTKAPVVCLDYLQIVPSPRESIKLGIDETVRKLKKFQRNTNTTFIVISSFNRMNYSHSVSFESFKESGNIEYTADVVWALQLYIMNEIRGGMETAVLRKKIDEAKKQQPRQIQLKCLKNRQGTNYDCFFEYYSAHDYFEPCDDFDEFIEEDEDEELLLPPQKIDW